jgi:hypothetical protein
MDRQRLAGSPECSSYWGKGAGSGPCSFESDRPWIVLWRRENGAQQRNEPAARTDENGVVVFPKVAVEKVSVSVQAKGYRSISRRINPKDVGGAIRIRLDKWRQVSG